MSVHCPINDKYLDNVMMIFYAVVLFKSFEALDRISVLYTAPPDTFYLLMHCPCQCQCEILRILNSVKLEAEISKSSVLDCI